MFYECTKWFLLSFLVLNSLLFLQYFIDGKNLLDDDLLKIFFRIKNETPLTIPISTFLAVLFAFSFLSKNNELIALDSTGISTFFILRPILILALVSTFVNLTFFDYKKSSNEFFNGDQGAESFSKKKFYSFRMILKKQNRTWFLKSYDLKSKQTEQVYLYQYDEEGNDIFRIEAASGKRTNNGWVLNNGRFLGFASDEGLPILENNSITWKVTKSISNKEFSINSTTPRFSKNFEILELNHILDDPTPFALLKLKPNDMSLFSISEIINTFPNSNSQKLYPYKYRRAQIICNFASSFFAVICALALIFWKQPSSKGAIIGLSILFSTLYYILFSACQALGEKGILYPWFGACLPFLVFTIFASFVLFSKR